MHRFFIMLFFITIHCLHAPAQTKVMFSNNYPPFNFTSEDGELSGFNVEIFESIIELYNSDIEIGNNTWENINTALTNGEIGAIGGTHYPGSIDQNYIYTRSTINTSHCFLFNKKFHSKFSIEVIRSSKQPKIVLWKNDVLIHYILSINPATEFIFVDNYKELLNTLDKEDVTCAIAQRIGGMYYASQMGKDYIHSTDNKILERNMGFKVSKQYPELAEVINHGLEVILSNGEYQRIYDKWILNYNEDRSLWEKYGLYVLPFFFIITLATVLLIFINRVLKDKVHNKTKDLQHQLDVNSLIVEELGIQKTKAEESEKMKSAFLANMSHEIRTPMNGILGFTELLESQDYTPEEQLQFIGVIKQSGHRMLNTINNIIDVSQLEAGAERIKIKEVGIKEILYELQVFFAPEAKSKGLELSFEGKDEMANCVFYSDEYKLNSILTNLIKNALKFTKKGSIKVTYSLHCDYVEFRITDTGIGIEKSKQEAMFKQFVQADNSHSSDFEGSGLGLSITKGYVHLLKGEIRMESELGDGTTFYIKIPNESQHSIS